LRDAPAAVRIAMTVVALSASYGAGGSLIGPELAQRLGVPFLDRAIPIAVAARLEISVDAVAAREQASESWLDRLLRGFVGTDVGVPAPLPADAFTSEDFRKATEEVLLRQAGTGEGVILGRAAVVVLRDEPRVLRVRLDGPRKARISQAMTLGGIDRESAEQALARLDRTHADYAKQFYGADLGDASLYHLMIDSTAIDTDACVRLIERAAGSLAERV
jgi:cytidylate kinase